MADIERMHVVDGQKNLVDDVGSFSLGIDSFVGLPIVNNDLQQRSALTVLQNQIYILDFNNVIELHDVGVA